MSDYILFKNLDHKYMTLKDLVPEEEKTEENAEEKAEEKEKTTIYYVTDEQQQSQYINMFRKKKEWMQYFLRTTLILRLSHSWNREIRM